MIVRPFLEVAQRGIAHDKSLVATELVKHVVLVDPDGGVDGRCQCRGAVADHPADDQFRLAATARVGIWIVTVFDREILVPGKRLRRPRGHNLRLSDDQHVSPEHLGEIGVELLGPGAAGLDERIQFRPGRAVIRTIEVAERAFFELGQLCHFG